MNIGETYKGYYIKEKIGVGAYGEVWLAQKESKEFALKILLNKNDDGIDKDKYDNEVRSLTKAKGHPNILYLHENFIKSGKYVLVTDYADGKSLKDKSFTLTEGLRIILQVLNGLNYLHSLNIIHRDIKPDNILLRNEIPCLADFGLARDLNTTQSNVLGGSESYFSPELATAYLERKPKEELSYVRTIHDDLWAITTTFYQLITNEFPFGSLLDKIKVIREPLPDNLPDELIDFFNIAFHKDQSKRFQSAMDLQIVLQKFESKKYESEIDRLNKLISEKDEQFKKIFVLLESEKKKNMELSGDKQTLKTELEKMKSEMEKTVSDIEYNYKKTIEDLKKQSVNKEEKTNSLISQQPISTEAFLDRERLSNLLNSNNKLPFAVSDSELDLHLTARGYAQLLIEGIKFGSYDQIELGRRNNDIYSRLLGAITKGGELYKKRVGDKITVKFDYFHDELVKVLANGDVSKMGKDYPGHQKEFSCSLCQFKYNKERFEKAIFCFNCGGLLV